MALALADRWIWDFWLVRQGERHHVFFLQAPAGPGDPEERHWHASIGHAVSDDLTHWEILADALAPGPPGAWDDASTWTGSIIARNDRWYLLYTGTSWAERGLVQRIGLASSGDLLEWRRHDGPVLEADPRWYETLDCGAWPDQAWRDPWVFVDGDDGSYHVLLTARSRSGDPAGRGVVGHARSADLVTWETLAPVTVPMGFGQMEVPQVVAAERWWYLLFSSDPGTQDEYRSRTGPGTGTYYLMGDGPTGPFTGPARALEADRRGSTYAGKLLRASDGQLVFLAWHRTRPDGRFHGALSDPRPVRIAGDGTLILG
jgi:beta-fructofuranosidase